MSFLGIQARSIHISFSMRDMSFKVGQHRAALFWTNTVVAMVYTSSINTKEKNNKHTTRGRQPSNTCNMLYANRLISISCEYLVYFTICKSSIFGFGDDAPHTIAIEPGQDYVYAKSNRMYISSKVVY